MDTTKKPRPLLFTCADCGQVNIVTSAKGRHSEYCGGKCRQRAHRKRKAAEDAFVAQSLADALHRITTDPAGFVEELTR